jgi:Protein of unknown function (DUF4238)
MLPRFAFSRFTLSVWLSLGPFRYASYGSHYKKGELMSSPRKHHYLPQFYLEGFKIKPQKGKEPHIWQVEKHGNQAHYSPAIADTGCIRDYHSLDFEDEEPDHKAIEAQLSKLEAEQATLVRTISETKMISPSQIEPLSAFISLMRYRVPAFAGHIERHLQSVVLDTFKIMYNAGQFGAIPPKLQELFNSKGIDETLQVNISNWKILSQMFEMGFRPENIGLLAKYNYHVYSAKDASFFVTADNPVALYHPNYDEIRPYGVGLAMKGVEVTFPLTSDTLIRAGHDLEPGTSIASAEEVNEFNRRSIIMSERYIFACSASAELRHLIGRYKDSRAGFVFDNLFHGDGSVHVSRFIPVQ